ncbi:MAG: DsbA family oxidoreductase, partial [Betaproteobacteria bacterium]|nr:DsbA family oxidoreductase [Betaproteobacteria bacterium]
KALERLDGQVTAEIHFQPFELNPDMPPGGQDLGEHLRQKYGSTPEQQARTRAMITARGAEVGFTFRPEGRGRVYNTFDAHRLLQWAAEEGQAGEQYRLKKALLESYQGRAECVESHEVLLAVVESAGLSVSDAQRVLDSGLYSDAVRERQALYRAAEIHAVPAIIINDEHLIEGGHPVEVFEAALREIAGLAPA